jgi:hypothetical protein
MTENQIYILVETLHLVCHMILFECLFNFIIDDPAKLYSSRPSIWYVNQYPSGNFFILHLMTLEHSRAKLYSSKPFIWYVTWFHLGIYFILHLMTPDHPRAKFYSSWPSIWYVTQYPSCNFLILHSMTLEHSWAKLHSLGPFIWYVTWYHLGNFFHFALDDPGPPQGWILLLVTFHLICHTIPFV